MGPIGMPEMIMIFIVILLLFGAKKLPELARGIGKSMGEFKKAKEEFEHEITRSETETRVKEVPEQRTPRILISMRLAALCRHARKSCPKTPWGIFLCLRPARQFRLRPEIQHSGLGHARQRKRRRPSQLPRRRHHHARFAGQSGHPARRRASTNRYSR